MTKEIKDEMESKIEVDKEIEEKGAIATSVGCKDPLTMDCGELGAYFRDLVKQDIKMETAIKKLEEIKTEMPSEGIDKIYGDAIKRREELDSEIDGVFDRAVGCRTSPPQEEPKETAKEPQGTGEEPEKTEEGATTEPETETGEAS